jgi:hypothetical protein
MKSRRDEVRIAHRFIGGYMIATQHRESRRDD